MYNNFLIYYQQAVIRRLLMKKVNCLVVGEYGHAEKGINKCF